MIQAKENQRITLTKRLISEALISLLGDKNIRRISIRELCAKAGVNRSTFYNHYGSQYDVLDEISAAFLEDIGKTIKTGEHMVLVLRYFDDNLNLSRLLINNIIDSTFSERLFSLPKIQELLDSNNITGHAEKQFIIHGSYQLLRDWINSDTRVSAESQTELILTLANKVCK